MRTNKLNRELAQTNSNQDIEAELKAVMQKVWPRTYIYQPMLTAIAKYIKEYSEVDPFGFVEPCEPDCSPERHAYHQGQWDMAGRMNVSMGKEPHP